jgi:hypothetical protein
MKLQRFKDFLAMQGWVCKKSDSNYWAAHIEGRRITYPIIKMDEGLEKQLFYPRSSQDNPQTFKTITKLNKLLAEFDNRYINIML